MRLISYYPPILAVLAVALCHGAGALASPLDDAQTAFERGDYQKALSIWTLLAAKEPEAGYRIGFAYEGGSGVELDYGKAAEWYRRAAEQGYAPAEARLGSFYHFGLAGEQDDSLAAQWQKKAAAQGFTEAQYNLGVYYEQGAGLSRDPSQAADWYKMAAQHGHIMALSGLAGLYLSGDGVAKDPVASVTLLDIARQLGSGIDRESIDEQMALITQQQSLSSTQLQQAADLAKRWKKGEPLPLP